MQLYIWSLGYTYNDMLHVQGREKARGVPSRAGPVAVNSGGRKGGQSVFSLGSRSSNLGHFILGWGPRWNTLTTVDGGFAKVTIDRSSAKSSA
eukprot:gene36127-66457_t